MKVLIGVSLLMLSSAFATEASLRTSITAAVVAATGETIVSVHGMKLSDGTYTGNNNSQCQEGFVRRGDDGTNFYACEAAGTQPREL